MTEELALVLFVFLVMCFLAFLTHKRYEFKKIQAGVQKKNPEALTENSVTVSELEQMITEAVSGVTVPLEERIDSLSSRLDLLDDMDQPPGHETDSDVHVGKTLGRQR